MSLTVDSTQIYIHQIGSSVDVEGASGNAVLAIVAIVVEGVGRS